MNYNDMNFSEVQVLVVIINTSLPNHTIPLSRNKSDFRDFEKLLIAHSTS